jgi:hypothetical protein
MKTKVKSMVLEESAEMHSKSPWAETNFGVVAINDLTTPATLAPVEMTAVSASQRNLQAAGFHYRQRLEFSPKEIRLKFHGTNMLSWLWNPPVFTSEGAAWAKASKKSSFSPCQGVTRPRHGRQPGTRTPKTTTWCPMHPAPPTV